MEKCEVLIVDDHEMIIEGYKAVLTQNYKDTLDLHIDQAISCREAYDKINFNAKIGSPYHIVCLDMNLPSAEELKLFSGEDVGIWVRETFPNISLMVMTMYSDNFRIHNIMKNIQPEVFILKKDVNPLEFVFAFDKCLCGEIYYSTTVSTFLRSSFTSDITLDSYDRSILYYLSKGIQTKELVDYVPLSLAGIEKRKRTMKEFFDINGGDLKLIDYAKRSGFL